MKIISDRDDVGKDNKEINVGIGDYQITENGNTLKTNGLGSCVGVAIYDKKNEIAGLLHAMLPSYEDSRDTNPAKYVDTGIEKLVNQMAEKGSNKKHLEAKIVGGSNMFDFSGENGTIGERNTKAAREKLKELNIPLKNEDTGGKYGRSIKLKPRSWNLEIKSVKKGVKEI
ncbi:Chemotaxis protein, stimulates methylation of MCP protein [Methanonatronarchaeum thermophilum]|uniref:Probable chemoreceptor glutamine deamidase CheD n=1 Tax=Methanonatronarchaeum thermophilum TaxID=1927129 RepID=A0A1Y3G9X4_9EURY|nr:hypothetical protein [Methanonatronarchaeum thermophilum]OUJ18209.1 Chemotaxis protein, stimulates methylation of MCP protein [Methanonatronarchaeum thermophilum]